MAGENAAGSGTIMTHRLLYSVFAVLFAMALAGCNSGEETSTDGTENGQPTQGASDAPAANAKVEYPEPFIFTSPKPGEAICLPHSLDIRLKLNEAMVVNGVHDKTAFDLTIDGRGILRETEFFPSRSFPQTHLALLHRMFVYDTGPHTVRVTYSTPEGSGNFEFGFTVKEDCL
jgi:hypothetical protein